MDISTMVFEFLSFYKGDIGLPPFVVLLVGAFFIVKAVLAKMYGSPSEEVLRPQRSADEEASLNAAKEAVRRKIAASKEKEGQKEGHSVLELPKKAQTLAAELAQTIAVSTPTLAPVSSPLPPKRSSVHSPVKAQCALKGGVIGASEAISDAPSRPSRTRAQKAFLSSLVFSKPKALT